MNNKTLWIIFITLLAIYLGSQLFSDTNKTSSFEPDLFAVDTASVTKIEIYSKADDYALTSLDRAGNEWTVSNGTITADAQSNLVTAMLSQIDQIRATRIAAKSQEKWPEFELDEATAKGRIKVFAGSKLIADFWAGGFRFNQQARSATSFIRKNDENDVYAIDGFLSMSLGQGFDSYRNNTLVAFNPADITKLSIQNNGAVQTLQKTPDGWITSEGIGLDSLKMTNYLTGISNLKSAKFADDFSEKSPGITEENTITITGNNLISPITVNCFKVPGRELPFICKSSLNPDAWVGVDSASVYSKLFTPVAALQ